MRTDKPTFPDAAESHRRENDALRACTERHRAILQTAMDGFWLADAQGCLLEVNETYCRMSGYSEQELLRMRIPDLEAAESADDAAAHMRMIRAQGRDRFASVHRRKDGSVFDVEVSAQYRAAGDGQFVAFVRDISERERAGQSLKESENRWRSYVENAPYGVFVADERARYIQVNTEASRVTGYTQSELLSRSIPDLLAPESRQAGMESFAELARTGKTLVELRYVTKPGELRWWTVAAVRLSDTRYLGYANDITDRKRVEATNTQLIETLDERVGQRTAELHDTVRRLENEISERKRAERDALEYQRQLQGLAWELACVEDRQRQQLAAGLHDGIGQILHAASSKLVALQRWMPSARHRAGFDEVLALLGKAIADTRELTFDQYPPVLYERGLAAAMKFLTEQFSSRNEIACRLVVDEQAPLPPVDIRGLLYQAARELLANVARHARATAVEVSIGGVGGPLTLTVCDNGIGFDPARIAPSTTTPSGFGLFNIRERLRALGGHVVIESSAGHGASVGITVPMREPPDLSGTCIRVMAADDHQIVLDGLRSLLDGQPDMALIGTATNGHDAVDLAASLRPDVAVLDITMPGANGLDAARGIREKCPDTEIVMLSMHTNAQLVADALRMGASGYVVKGASWNDLTVAIRTVVTGETFLSPRLVGAVPPGLLRRSLPPEGVAASALAEREMDVLRLLAEGKSSKEIATRLFLTTTTIVWYRQRIMQKLGLRTVAELTKYAIRMGLTPLD